MRKLKNSKIYIFICIYYFIEFYLLFESQSCELKNTPYEIKIKKKKNKG